MSSWGFGEVCYNGGQIRPPVKPALKGDGHIGKQTSCAWGFKLLPPETSLLKRELFAETSLLKRELFAETSLFKRELFTMEVPINQ